MSILDQIVAQKKLTVSESKKERALSLLEQSPLFDRPCLSLKHAIMNANATGIITEIKRKSPSKGIINESISVPTVAAQYETAGASALSVLTDLPFFGGSNEDLTIARSVVSIPILRKDFIVDAYQIYEAKAIGADAILLIASVLPNDALMSFTSLAHDVGLEVLLEIHAKDELEAVGTMPDLVGINNRNLKTFEVSLQHSIEMVQALPENVVAIAESGLRTVDDIIKLRDCGFHGFLMGQTFMEQPDPGQAAERFIKTLQATIH